MRILFHSLFLMVFSGLSLNLFLLWGLGMRNSALRSETYSLPLEGPPPIPQWRAYALCRSLVITLTILVVWTLFALNPLPLGFLQFPLLLPACSLTGTLLEALGFRVFHLKREERSGFEAKLCYDGLSLAGTFLCLRIAASFLEALVLSLGFSGGFFSAVLIIRSVLRRSILEAVPRPLRGMPLLLISLGLLCLLTGGLSRILLKILAVLAYTR